MEVPENLCIIPFIHLSTTTHGHIRPCCFSTKRMSASGDASLANFGSSSLNEIWNGDDYKKLRMQMIANEKVTECRHCWDEEKAGKRSKRVKENHKYLAANRDIVSMSATQGGIVNKGPFHHDIRLGNLCNLKCRSCNPACSTVFEKERQTKWSDSFFLKNENYIVGDNRWYKQSQFFENMEKAAKDTQTLYISGGEPLLIPEMHSMIEKLVRQGAAPNISLRFNSNLTILNLKFLDLLQTFKSVEISASIDAVGGRLTYIRHPADWKNIEYNFCELLQRYPKIELTVNCTVSVMNIFYLQEMYDWLRSVENKFGKPVPLSIDLVHDPLFLSIKIIPKYFRPKVQSILKQLLNDNSLTKPEKKDILSLFNLLEEGEEYSLEEQNKFTVYMQELDRIRDENIRQSLPEVADILDYCKKEIL